MFSKVFSIGMNAMIMRTVVCFFIGVGLLFVSKIYSQVLDKSHEEGAIRKEFAKLSAKVSELPELFRLKTELEKAQRVYAEAFEAEMKKENAELFEKYKALQEIEMERFNRARSGVSSSSNQSGYNQLSNEEKKRVYEARKQAMSVPTVKEAREKRNAAKTDEERNSTESEYKAALKKAMLESDKELEPLLNKLEGRTNPSPNISPAPAQ